MTNRELATHPKVNCPNCLSFVLTAMLGAGACGDTNDARPRPAKTPTVPHGFEQALAKDMRGAAANYIPAQCYVKTQDADAVARNSCYTCHHDSQRPNGIADADLQLAYSFADAARYNPWENLFEDRSAEVARTDDAAILAWVREDNYAGVRPLQTRLSSEFPSVWDANGDGKWNGFIPDAGYNFDAQGFDQLPDGQRSGWRSFAFRPFPGAFWPTNGSMGDSLIRLPLSFRQDEHGKHSAEVYVLNLAILDALIQREDRQIPDTDERRFGVDLNRDGKLGIVHVVTFDWSPLRGRNMSWVGRAAQLQREGEVHLAAGLYPVGTEFLHSVRYMDVVNDKAVLAARMKELRYARKRRWLSYADLTQAAGAEAKEKDDFPDRLRTAWGEFERGVPNGQGWVFQGFIEDAYGDLRPQTLGETRACVGCHGGVGATQDSIFSFGRKLDDESFAGGWFHPSTHRLEGVPDAPGRDGTGEYATWLREVGAADEFGTNEEARNKAFDEHGKLRKAFEDKLRADIRTLIIPSAARALALNKAYRAIVAEQDFVWGRDATTKSVEARVWRELPIDELTGIEAPRRGESWHGLVRPQAAKLATQDQALADDRN